MGGAGGPGVEVKCTTRTCTCAAYRTARYVIVERERRRLVGSSRRVSAALDQDAVGMSSHHSYSHVRRLLVVRRSTVRVRRVRS